MEKNITREELREELKEVAKAIMDDATVKIKESERSVVNLLTGVICDTEDRIMDHVVGEITATRVLIEDINDKFEHAAEYDRTVIEKIERERAEQEAINGKVDMRLLRLEAVRKPRKRYA